MARRHRRQKRELPTEPVRLRIDRLSHEGRGVGTIDGKIAFVEGALPGETVDAVYTASKSSFDEFKTLSVIESSRLRVEPTCKFFGTCGGCSLQHFDGAAQLTFKQDMLIEQLGQATGLSSREIPILERVRDAGYHYRRKARLAVRYVAKKGGTLIGFRERHSSFITVMDDCPVLVPELARLIAPLRSLIDSLDARTVIPQIEVAAGDGEQNSHRVALVFRHLASFGHADLERLRAFADQEDCDVYLQPGDGSTIRRLWPEGREDRLQYRLEEFGLTMQFHPVDFVQVNAGINRQAIRLAIELLDLQPEDSVLDLFCGLGNFSLPMASRCRQVTGIEGSELLVERARRNSRDNGIANVDFHVANLYGTLTDVPWMQHSYDKILLDPPRSGAIEVIGVLAGLGASHLVYVSCNPATLARDTAALIAAGYTLAGAGVMDMFPQTTHVESIALFVRDRKAAGRGYDRDR